MRQYVIKIKADAPVVLESADRLCDARSLAKALMRSYKTVSIFYEDELIQVFKD